MAWTARARTSAWDTPQIGTIQPAQVKAVRAAALPWHEIAANLDGKEPCQLDGPPTQVRPRRFFHLNLIWLTPCLHKMSLALPRT
jgi:hypothetical protein